MVADLDLNLCRQVKVRYRLGAFCNMSVTMCVLKLCVMASQDKWGFQMTARHELYAELLQRYIRPDFRQQIIKDASG